MYNNSNVVIQKNDADREKSLTVFSAISQKLMDISISNFNSILKLDYHIWLPK